MKITSISVQVNNQNRVNVSVDGKYLFSLDVFQVSELGLKVGREYSETDLLALEQESQFGKVYALALEYCMVRPRSVREVQDYLYRKTKDRKVRSRKDGRVIDKKGISNDVAKRVQDRLVDKGYLNDERFAKYWVENRFQRKGVSLRRLTQELSSKGVGQDIINSVIKSSSRDDKEEIKKVIAKKQSRYPDEQKLIQYLIRQGFGYDDIKNSLNEET